jgi:perosamine synthetase
MNNTGLISTPSERHDFEPGAPARDGFIPLCVPEIRGNEWLYVKECLDTGWVSSVGSYVKRFEEGISERVGARYGIAAVNGTAALHIALLVAGVAPDDEVLVSDLTFIAPANAIHYAHAHPVFVDAEPSYWQIDAARVVDFLEKQCRWTNGELRNKATGRRVSAIVPVHILGHPVDMQPILEAARKYDLAVVEDATESLGAKYKDEPVGHLGDIACFSFNGNKLITTGGGGLIVTDNQAWAEKVKYLTTQAKDDPVEYVHKEIGYNYRLTNIQAAVGCAQLEQLDQFMAIKRRIAATYTEAFKDVPGITPMREATWASSVFWLYTVLVDEREFGIDSRALLRHLEHHGIQARPLWQPLHLSEPYARAQQASPCVVAEELNRRALSLPCSVGLTETQLQTVIAAVSSATRR